MAAADAERRGDGEVRQAVGVGDLLDEAAAGLPVGYPLAQKHVQDRAAGVLALQLVLVVEGVERIVGAGDGQMGRVGVVGRVGRAGLDNAGETFGVLFGEAVGRALGGRGLEVEEVAGLLLVVSQLGPHELQDFKGKAPAFGRADVFA